MNQDLFGAFLDGTIFMGNLAITLIFFKFWRKTNDALFSYLGFAFAALTVERALLIHASSGESSPAIYLMRLVAFAIIIVAIVRKNTARPADVR